MKIARAFLLSLSLLGMQCVSHASGPNCKSITLIEYGTLRFNTTKLEAHPGEKIVLTIKNEADVLKHKWVLLDAGVDPQKYAKQSLSAAKDDALARSLAKQVLVASPELSPGQSHTVTFLAPAVPGSYPYICDCPLHYAGGMGGVLIVR